jgi:uncharacterized protein YbjT (DUF2867 family)
MSGSGARPLLLLVGGGGGLAGRAVLREFASDWRIRSVHRSRTESEARAGVEWVRADVATVPNWNPLLDGVDVVINLAWYRRASRARFRSLADGLVRLIEASPGAGVRRWVQLSVPDAPDELERGLPYLVEKRRVDRALAESSLSYSVVRSAMLFGPDDVLLTVMLRTMARYRRFPMFGDGEYHVSPIAAADVARILRREAGLSERHTVSAGGPVRWRYADLTDAMFRALGLPPRYVHLSPTGAIRLARFLEMFGSSLLYAYEVRWLLSDRLGPRPYEGLETALSPVEPFLAREAARYARRSPSP